MSFLATVRACRRQKNNRLGDTPWRRATAATFAPGASVSAMIRIFSSSDQRRRRSTLPRTSTRIKIDLKARLETGTSWDDLFPTDQAALDEALKTIREEFLSGKTDIMD